MKIYDKEIWFVTGSQHLYGDETLKQVEKDSRVIAEALQDSDTIPAKIVYKALVTTASEITDFCQQASSSPACMGVITWMHTFSPAQMWAKGIQLLKKPLLHFHTQYNRDIPWETIDMDYMNLHQSAHGGREYGFLLSRMGSERKVVVGHWQDSVALEEIGVWIRAVAAWDDAQGARIARFGDNMRDVAVTEGDKVEALLQLGYHVQGFGIGDLAEMVQAVDEKAIDNLVETYLSEYVVPEELLPAGSLHASLRDSARIEIGLRKFLESGNFTGFTTTFEDLHGIAQLPGLACQRLMADGYGFGAEGDWKTAALVRAMKVMARGLSGGTSFMEDYTYHLDPENPMVLGAHMLEVCPSIAAAKPRLEIKPLAIGGKADPARLIFHVPAGKGLNASLMDMGNRFRLLVNEVEVVASEQDLPELPVAHVLWKPLPDLKTGAAAWIYGGGAHHTGFTMALTVEHLQCFADIAGFEMAVIDADTRLTEFRNNLKLQDMYYGMKGLARRV